MALDDLPTQTDESIGREKADRPRPLPIVYDRRYEVPPDEHNRRTELLIELAKSVGSAASWRVFDDFFEDPTSGVRWTIVAGGAGSSVSIVPASSDPASVEGGGWCALVSGGDALSTPAIRWLDPVFRRGQGPIFEARVKLPATLANANFIGGFQFGTDPTYALITTKDNGKWEVLIGSDAIPAVASQELVTPAPVAGGIYTVRVELLADEATANFYIDGTLVATLETATPEPTEALHAVIRCARKAGAGGTVYVDYVEVRGSR
jgi:hypothetical protein